MNLDDLAAVALATILVSHDHGADVLSRQLPLHATSLGNNVLVEGTPYDDALEHLSSCMSYVLFRRSDAEILDFGFNGRMELSTELKEKLRRVMSKADFDRMTGPRPAFVPDPARPDRGMELMRLIDGGLINGNDVAKTYGAVLLEAVAALKSVDRGELRAWEIAGVWHVARVHDGKALEVLTFERSTGRVLTPGP